MDVIEFTYFGPSSFYVNISESGGNTKGVEYHMTNVEPENEGVNTSARVTSRKGYHSMKRMKPLDMHESDDKGKEFIIISSDEDSEYRPCDSYDETCEEDFRVGNGQTKRPKSRKRDVRAPMNRKRVDPLDKELFKIRGILKPKNKYFVTRVQPNRRNELYIPKNILVDENLKIPKKIELVDTKGNTYTSRKMVCRDGRTFYKGGWSRLGRRNHLRDNDLCVCEFGKEDKYGFLFISFVRFIE